jgi:hypothetical protein
VVPLMMILAGLVGTAIAAVAVHVWPQIMSWTREHLLPWVDEHIPWLAAAVRLAFQDLDQIADELRRAVRTAWRELRAVLLSQTVTFVRLADGSWAVRIVSFLRDPGYSGKPAVQIVTHQCLNWQDISVEADLQALPDSLDGCAIDILAARDMLLAETA